jgi:hypothetical protein
MLRLRPRINLNVPFQEKDELKSLKTNQNKVEWDPDNKKWYLPEGGHSVPFERWLPHPIGTIRSDQFYVAHTVITCWNCDQTTDIHAILLPVGYEVFERDEQSLIESWKKQKNITFLNYISWIHPDALSIIATHVPVSNYHSDESYISNYCEKCSEKQSDVYLFGHPGEVFSPTTAADAHKITITLYDHTFVAISRSFDYDKEFLNQFDLKKE